MEWLQDFAVAAPAAALAGLIVGFIVGSRYTVTKRKRNGE